MRVLIVEDEPVTQKLLKTILNEHGDVLVATSAEDGFRLFMESLDEGSPLDLICLDIKLPGLDGIQMLDEIRLLEQEEGIQSSKGVKIIVTTGLDDAEALADATAAGCTSYLRKPIDSSKLLSELKRLDLIGH